MNLSKCIKLRQTWAPHACAQSYHPSSGSHGQLFRPYWGSSVWHWGHFFSVKLVPANLSSKSKLTNCSLSKVVLIKEANRGLNMKNLAQFFQVASHFLAIGLPKIYSGRVIRKRSEPLFLDFQKILKCFYGEHIYTVGYGTHEILRYKIPSIIARSALHLV